MNVFELDRALIGDYEQFARSFTLIRAADLRAQIDGLYSAQRFWPEPLLSINPRYEAGPAIPLLVDDGTLHPDCAKIFRLRRGEAVEPLRLHRHQGQAVAKGRAGQSFVVTTGTGSGKSLCFFIPIIDAILRARQAGEPRRTRAVVIYPMNALANSQLEELEKFVGQSGIDHPPTFARYTGQEKQERREQIAEQVPDILLTNFMMLELLMTRQDELDRKVIGNCEGLDFLVLDELHTYRGRQGADVAMLVRRVRERLKPDGGRLICIGTSATMASEGSAEGRADTVAKVASTLFAAEIGRDGVIDESLERATHPALRAEQLGEALGTAIDQGVPPALDDSALWRHPLAVWIEMELGLQDGQVLRRRPPSTLSDAAERLARQAGRDRTACETALKAMLLMVSQPEAERGGAGEGAFLAFKLHRFISGAGHAHATLRPPPNRRVSLEGQQFHPADREARLYPTFFCRNCGQEHHPVTIIRADGNSLVLPRPVDEMPLQEEERSDGPRAGFLMPEPADGDFNFTGNPEDYPEDWQEPARDGAVRLRANRRSHAAEPFSVAADGRFAADGRRAWFLPGRFRFCPACGDTPNPQGRDINKLAALSGEGRSSATTILVASALRAMNATTSAVPADRRKLLSFTDNRQDAALQAGHFNDFVFVSLLRAAILRAVRDAGRDGVSDEVLGRRVQEALGFTAAELQRRAEWMLEPGLKGVAQLEAEGTLARVLAHRAWADQRRGWRFTNPNLEELGLLQANYLAVEELCADEASFSEAPELLIRAEPARRAQAFRILLDHMRRGLAVNTEALDHQALDQLPRLSRGRLRTPWSFGEEERPLLGTWLVLNAPRRHVALKDETIVLRGGRRSVLGRTLSRESLWGARLTSEDYERVLLALLKAAGEYGLVVEQPTPLGDAPGWRLAPQAVRFRAAEARSDQRPPNPFFRVYYETLADMLADGGRALFGFEAREHTAQVKQDRREYREWRFRCGSDDLQRMAERQKEMQDAGEPARFLPVLFCSPTMELGVDISALNVVYLRNVPPTPANYVQRSGRAGRSGQAALIVTYCAAQSPHDQYFFRNPLAMVNGVVRAPTLDLANEELMEAHLQAIWLAEMGIPLSSAIAEVLDLHAAGLPIREELQQACGATGLSERAAARMQRLMAMMDKAPWTGDPAEFAQALGRTAPERFDAAFARWRDLYVAARAQMEAAHRIQQMPGIGKRERDDAKRLWLDATERQRLLESGTEGSQSDFYTYRYLATEGFLPGYNFPRLPLMAYVPAVERGTAKPTYLQRARFLALAEFGPMSLIYHEGRAYRVHKATLPPALRTDGGRRLATWPIWVCDQCGGAHEHVEPERCHACMAPMGGVHPIHNALRIDNVETLPAERITANDEERQRQGFELQTVFQWPRRGGRLDIRKGTAEDEEGVIAELEYGAGAKILRLNKGLRRRREKTLLGFKIDPMTGRWAGSGERPGEEAPDDPDKSEKHRIVPVVEDRKNALLVSLPRIILDTSGMATLQHALARGLELVFQLEEGEVLTEATPDRERRRAILIYEASEGGAGVLTRLIGDPGALAEVARAALRLMHYDLDGRNQEEADPATLQEEPNPQCVKGCYRCLLSYYNQPDHDRIDRTRPDVLRILLRLARSRVGDRTASARSDSAMSAVTKPSDDGWRSAIARWGLPEPDPQPLAVDGFNFALTWRDHLVTAAPEPIPPGAREAAEAKGFAVAGLPNSPEDQAPPTLASLLKDGENV